jgi:hypothetical protein
MICRDQLHAKIWLEELITAALSFGAGHEQTHLVRLIIVSLKKVTVRGKIG